MEGEFELIEMVDEKYDQKWYGHPQIVSTTVESSNNNEKEFSKSHTVIKPNFNLNKSMSLNISSQLTLIYLSI